MAEPATTTETSQTTQPSTPQVIGEDRVRVRAYELYQKRNGAPGDPESDWYRAEAELRDEAEQPARRSPADN